jgi:hypothetical protein
VTTIVALTLTEWANGLIPLTIGTLRLVPLTLAPLRLPVVRHRPDCRWYRDRRIHGEYNLVKPLFGLFGVEVTVAAIGGHHEHGGRRPIIDVDRPGIGVTRDGDRSHKASFARLRQHIHWGFSNVDEFGEYFDGGLRAH